MKSELSLRHLPDISGAAAASDFSDSSFQIPPAVVASNDLLLDDDSMELLLNVEDTLRTPGPMTRQRQQQLLTLTDRTPRSRPARTVPIRSSLRPRPGQPGIPTPLRGVVAADLSVELTEDLSPIRNQEASFQIPTTTANADLLSNSSDILNCADLTVDNSPVPSKEKIPYTLGQVATKRKELLLTLPRSIKAKYVDDVGGLQASTDGDRIPHVIKAETSQVVPDSSTPSTRPLVIAKRVDKPRRKKSTVIGGGITKPGMPKSQRSAVSRILSTAKSEGSGDTTQRPWTRTFTRARTDERKVGQTALTSGASGFATGGLAGTLMSYGQNYMGSRVDSPDANAVRATVSAIASSSNVDTAVGQPSGNMATEACRDPGRDAPLTVSQLSPPSSAETRHLQPHTAGRSNSTRPPSPARLSAKRSVSVASIVSTSNQRKRIRTAPIDSAHDSSGQAMRKTREAHSRARTAEVCVAASSSGHVRHPSADPLAKGVQIRPGFSTSSSRSTAERDGKGESSKQLMHTREPPANARSASRSGDLRGSQKENAPDVKLSRPEAANGHMHRPERIPAFDKPVVALPPAKPTKPIEFHFQSDARIEARKAEMEKSNSIQKLSRSHASLPIPDFKAMHAAHESALAARKEEIVPVVPMEFELNTDLRAREREKFEEARREREREIEQRIEERKRLREIEEEKEIRELRKRTVPKANEVPEWYANAPKRAGKSRT